MIIIDIIFNPCASFYSTTISSATFFYNFSLLMVICGETFHYHSSTVLPYIHPHLTKLDTHRNNEFVRMHNFYAAGTGVMQSLTPPLKSYESNYIIGYFYLYSCFFYSCLRIIYRFLFS